MHRRGFLRVLSSVAGLALVGQARRALAEWNARAFAATSEADALAEAFAGRPIRDSDAISVEVLDLIEDGAVVPVQVRTTLPRPRSITLLVDKNPNPLIARFELGASCRPMIATRIKVAEPSQVLAVVESDGALFGARKFVRVMQGGCN